MIFIINGGGNCTKKVKLTRTLAAVKQPPNISMSKLGQFTKIVRFANNANINKATQNKQKLRYLYKRNGEGKILNTKYSIRKYCVYFDAQMFFFVNLSFYYPIYHFWTKRVTEINLVFVLKQFPEEKVFVLDLLKISQIGNNGSKKKIENQLAPIPEP